MAHKPQTPSEENSSINSWVNPLIARVPRPTLGSPVPKGLMRYGIIYYPKAQSKSLATRLPSQTNYLEFIVLGHWSSMHRAALSAYPG